MLNERESNKARIAEALEARLNKHNITSFRLEIDKNIQRVLLEKLPRVLVIDYLLGDYTTGLDVLTAINSVPESKRPRTIFLTDEPSVPVAVEALRLGAVHYLEIDNPQSVNNAVLEIENILKQFTDSSPVSKVESYSLKRLVAHARKSAQLIEQAQSIVLKGAPITVIHAKRGAGSSTLAMAMQAERKSKTHCISIDLSTFDHNFLDFAGLNNNSANCLRLGKNLSLIIDRAEEDDGSILSALADLHQKIWIKNAKENSSFLSVCTTDADTFRAWKKLTSAEGIEVPSLKDRPEDFAPLLQRFVMEAEQLADKKIKPLNQEMISWISSLNWIGELKQLRSVITNALITSTFSDEDIKHLIEDGLDFSNKEIHAQSSNLPISPILAATILEQSNFNYQIAAAKLGCGPAKLRQMLAL